MPYFLIAPTGDAHLNLARDEYLLDSLAPGEIALYLYVNAPSVIIGVNQNPYLECDLNKLDADGVRLVRRMSGGGAVYHDSGNLNFSFIAHRDIYDEARQNRVILNALRRFGIDATLSGRNDISFSSLKFSGCAFCQRGQNRLHHGTLLINARLDSLGRYLTPSKIKLEAKGIKSVRARVCNLSEINPDITVETMKAALKDAFEGEYGESRSYAFSEEAKREIACLKQKRASRDWVFNETPAFDAVLEGRAPFGNARLCLKIEKGIISRCRLYTDSLDTDISSKIQTALENRPFTKEDIAAALKANGLSPELLSSLCEQ
ncbi:MAG: lipoate--protein ligase [Clostridia bacterium]|nr:lipoate--protein ligase [Clostridia bacterium]